MNGNCPLSVREDAAAAIARLRTFGVSAVMLTGDNRRTGAAIAGVIGIEVQAELLPDAKLAAIGEMKARGPVAMIGDGINDAPALAAASVGFAMGGGADVTLETAVPRFCRTRFRVSPISASSLGRPWAISGRTLPSRSV